MSAVERCQDSAVEATARRKDEPGGRVSVQPLQMQLLLLLLLLLVLAIVVVVPLPAPVPALVMAVV